MDENFNGHLFKQIRLEKKLTLHEVAEGIISIPSLSRFENDKIDLPFLTVCALVKRLEVSPEEYVTMAAAAPLNTAKSFEQLVSEASDANDTSTLADYYFNYLAKFRASQASECLIKAAIAAGAYFDLTGKMLLKPRDAQTLFEQISSVNYWGKREIQNFGNVTQVLSDKHCLAIAKIIFSNLADIRQASNRNYMDALNAILNTHYTLIINGSNLAVETEKLCQVLTLTKNMPFTRLRRHFLSLLLSYELGDPQADAKLTQLLTFLKLSDNEATASDFESAITFVRNKFH